MSRLSFNTCGMNLQILTTVWKKQALHGDHREGATGDFSGIPHKSLSGKLAIRDLSRKPYQPLSGKSALREQQETFLESLINRCQVS